LVHGNKSGEKSQGLHNQRKHHLRYKSKAHFKPGVVIANTCTPIRGAGKGS